VLIRYSIDQTTMEDKTLTIVFGCLGAMLALVSILVAYLQLRGFRPVIVPDEEQAVALAAVLQGEPAANPPAAVVQEEHVPNTPYASSLATQLCDRADSEYHRRDADH
jgi:hypothetical protein